MIERIADAELCEILERNGYPSAAERIASGEDQASATAYIRGQTPYYNDGEGQWLQDYIEGLTS